MLWRTNKRDIVRYQPPLVNASTLIYTAIFFRIHFFPFKFNLTSIILNLGPQNPATSLDQSSGSRVPTNFLAPPFYDTHKGRGISTSNCQPITTPL